MDLGSMICEYVKEKENLDCVFNKHGFMFYRIENDYILITDAYVVEKQKGHGRALLEEVKTLAKALGKTKIKTIIGNHKWVDSSLIAQLAVGFKVTGIYNNQIILELGV